MKTTFTMPTDTTIAYERRFTAAPERVWEAYTTPDLVRQWLGYGEFIACEMDIRDGGSYRWVWQLPDFRLEITGEVIEARPPHRLVSVERMSDVEHPPARSTIEFLPDGEGTLMKGLLEYDSRELRDAAYATGMANGMDDSFTKLDALG